MDDTTIAAIIEAARALPLEEQGQWIARQAIAAAREADAGISAQALEAEFQVLYRKLFGSFPSGQAVELAITWGRHLLRSGRQAITPDPELLAWFTGVRNA
jgi:hypothetical protein